MACGMLVHSSSMAVRSFWILAGTGTRCRIHRSRASQTCPMGNMPGEYVGHARTGMFQLPGIVNRSLQHRTVHYHAATRVGYRLCFFRYRCQIDTVKTVPVPKRCLNRYLQNYPLIIGLAISTKHMGPVHRQGLD